MTNGCDEVTNDDVRATLFYINTLTDNLLNNVCKNHVTVTKFRHAAGRAFPPTKSLKGT
jgi:hypothetical protein